VTLKYLENGEGETNCPMHTRYTDLTQRLIDAILTSPGETDPTLRRAIEEQSAQWSSRSPHQVEQVPPELVTYVKKVALNAYKTTEEDIEALRRTGYDEDAIFEITLSAALGAGMTRLERGLAALKGDTDASQKD
jgi:alkylhydroperoxidase family enzyme